MQAWTINAGETIEAQQWPKGYRFVPAAGPKQKAAILRRAAGRPVYKVRQRHERPRKPSEYRPYTVKNTVETTRTLGYVVPADCVFVVVG